MKIRQTLLLLLTPVLIAACGQQADPTTASSAPAAQSTPAETAAPASAEVAPTGEAAQSTDAGSATNNTGPAASVDGSTPVAGVDYVEIPGGKPFANAPGKIEVVEVFGYWCGHCAAFEPLFNAWRARQADDVNVVTVPAVFRDDDFYPQAFYAAEAMGVLERTHDATFNAIHLERKLHPVADIESIASFYATLGIDKARFLSTVNSFAVKANLGRAVQFATRSGVAATPTLVVNGKYRVTGEKSQEDNLRIADYLVSLERAAQQ